jgi:hypothetical protein
MVRTPVLMMISIARCSDMLLSFHVASCLRRKAELQFHYRDVLLPLCRVSGPCAPAPLANVAHQEFPEDFPRQVMTFERFLWAHASLQYSSQFAGGDPFS